MLRLGVTRGFGATLRRFIGICASNRVKGFLAGMAITTMLQSSMAAILMVASFAGRGFVTTGSALAVVLGADVGTTLIAQLLSFDFSMVMPIAMILGYILFSVKHDSGKTKNIGRILVGLALMLLALEIIREATGPLKESETLPLILKPLQSDPFFALMISALLTWIIHSSLAFILLLLPLASEGVLPMDVAVYMVLGANLGGTIAPIITTLKEMPETRRIPLGNMIIRLGGVTAAYIAMPFIHPYLPMLDGEGARQIVNLHTGFNLVLALFCLPLTNVMGRLTERLIPDRIQPDDPARPLYLDDNSLDTPSVALAAATRETLRMGDLLLQMLRETIDVFRNNDDQLLAKVREQDNTIDRIYAAIKIYMAKVTQEFMDPKEAQRYVQILTFSTNLEHAGDVIDKNLLPLAQKKIRNDQDFSKAGFKEIEHIHSLVVESVQLAQSIFVSGDIAMARKLLEDKEIIRKAESEAMTAHIDRLRGGVPETIATSSLHLDIIRDYRRINTYMCAVALPLLEEKGELHASLLKPRKED